MREFAFVLISSCDADYVILQFYLCLAYHKWNDMSLLISFSASGYVHDKESDLLAILDALIISAKI